MWAALRSDLSEFVSGVAEETDNVIGSSTLNKFSEDGEVLEGGFEATGVVQSPQDEVTRLQGHAETYQEPLDENYEVVQEFLESFKIDDKTQEIAKLLEDYPDTVKVHFETLVPTEIPYDVFWQRYFYRCDPARIEQEWEEQEGENRQARMKALAGGLSSVTSLFGGAMAAVSKAVTSESRSDGEEVPASHFGLKSSSGNVPAGKGLNLFGAGGRPPFVMNTAVDEDEDDGEEEEELGWDDDEEDEDEGGDEEDSPSDAMDVSEEITFTGGNNPEIERLSEQLVQALSERDALKETIALQNKEIADLKVSKPDSASSAKAIERLKLSLFEKDSELAALKASLEDTHEDDDQVDYSKKDAAKIPALESEVERLTGMISEKDAELAAAKEVAEEARAELARMREHAASEQDVLQTSLDMAKAETESLRQALESMSGHSEELDIANEKLTASQATAKALDDELAKMKMELADVKQRSAEKEQEMVMLKEHLVLLEARQVPVSEPNEEAALKHLPRDLAPEEEERASPSSESTGVKVEKAPPVRPDDAEDDWGDDWGDDDDE